MRFDAYPDFGPRIKLFPYWTAPASDPACREFRDRAVGFDAGP